MTLRERFGLGSEAGPQAEDVDVDDLLAAVRNRRRRHLVQHLARDHGPEDVVTISQLAEYVAAVEFGPDFDGAERKAVYVALYQTHLDALEDVGAVECVDDRERAYRPGPNAAALAEVIDVAERVAGETVRGDEA
ncbi:DUF7344 domain-containing protein [Salinilacihabitans rarus]|uniref:DUF7344 domain-containing protein n=1 Tax=Salinilacihabitans rarus TaxID=2961596 RepID=UPI0020C8EC32|nr:hypothetical protein [Salinilacihabitans rarus]